MYNKTLMKNKENNVLCTHNETLYISNIKINHFRELVVLF